jgi:Tubulin like
LEKEEVLMVNIHDIPLLESERPLVVTAPRILTPTLMVLLGSTPALAGLELMRHMLTLRPSDQRRVAIVYIDTDDPPAPLIEFRRQYNNVFQEFPLRIAVPAGISNAERIDEVDQHTFIEKKVPQYFANGAGGIRNNGHVAACFNYQYINDVLDRALVAISRLSTEQNVSKVHEVQANIVAFLGGGTGSGILVDVAATVRDILTHYQYKQRLNLFCMLPEPISGSSLNDLSWRKSNATASLLEVLAYSRAAAKDPVKGYEKYMRGRVHRLTNDPIANEVYLIGHASMDDAGDTARIVGLDLFQRTTDASGVGFLEHSRWVDRRTLGSSDDRGLPTMFGTSCPLEVHFPVEETATAFAQVSASYLLPLLASYQPSSVNAGEVDKREWIKEWRTTARFDSSINDPLAIKVGEFRRGDFEEAAQAQLDILWSKVERSERATETRIKEIIDLKGREELRHIKEMPQQDINATGSVSLIDRRIQHLKRLQQEYTIALDDLTERDRPRVPRRPTDLETKLLRQPSLPGPLQLLARDHAGAVCEAYNERLRMQARATRYRRLEQLLKDLQQRVQTELKESLSWLENAEADERAKELRNKGTASMAWQGRLEHPHPHQRHLFDLHTLRAQDDRNVAVERLYLSITGGEHAAEEGKPIDYSSFVGKCVEYLARNTSVTENNMLSINDQIAGRLADRVVSFFCDYYLKGFEDINLFELLNVAAPPPRRGQPRTEQISNYLLEHLEHIRGLMSSLVAFEEVLWKEGLSALDTSVYMDMHWRDGNQEALLSQTLSNLGMVTRRGQTPVVNRSLDPHRLQISYGQHAISLNTVSDFYLDQNSAMQYYLEYQKVWRESGSNGLMPVHSSGEAQRLVWDKDALGYTAPLPELVIRRPSSNVSSRQTQGQNVARQPMPLPKGTPESDDDDEFIGR